MSYHGMLSNFLSGGLLFINNTYVHHLSTVEFQ